MSVHPTGDELLLFLRGGLRAERVAAVAAHLQHCRACAAAAMTPDHVARAGASLAQAIDPAADEHPFVETRLTAYVDGILPPEEREAIEDHLRHCSICREDVDDLRAVAAVLPSRRPARWPWLAAAAAAAILIAMTLFMTRDTVLPETPPSRPRVTATAPTPLPPAPPRERYARAEWNAAVRQALRRGALAMPAALAELQLPSDPERGTGPAPAHVLEPSAAIVEETRPRFLWTPIRNATYVVSVFEGQNLVMESPPLRQPQWQPPRNLSRGRVYQWQVSARAGDAATILPAPPAPPALFRILGAPAHAELDAARAAHGDDPLLLGVLYARHGLRAEAERELSRVATDEGRRLLRSVQGWRTGS